MSDPRKKRDKSKDRELIGKTIAGRYRVLDILGQGGFGSVFLVEMVAGLVGGKLALKLVPADLSGNEKVKAQFLNEIRVAMRPEMVNKYIVQIRDVGETGDGHLYFTMDYCPGETLAAVLNREGPLAPLRAVGIILRILEALKTAHAAGIIHRDLKPANVMVVRKGSQETIRVLDFGIATAVIPGGPSQPGFVGSIHYMPPEQFHNEKLGFYTDTYAVGVILYECLTGQKPYHGRTAKEVFDDLKSRPAVPPEAVQPQLAAYPGLSRMVSRAIERNPELRYATARQFLEDLQSILQPQPQPAPPPSPARPSSPVDGAFPPRPPRGGEGPPPEGAVKERSPAAHWTGRGSGNWWKPLAAAGIAAAAAAGLWFALKPGRPAAAPPVMSEERQEPAVVASTALEFQRRLGSALEAQKSGAWKEALAEAEEALKINAGVAEVHRLRGEALLRLGRPGEAFGSFQTASSLSGQTASDPVFDLMVLEAFDGLASPDPEARALEARAFGELTRDPLNGATTPQLFAILSKRKGDPSEEFCEVLRRAQSQGVPGAESYWRKYVVEPRKARAGEMLRAAETALSAGDFQAAVEKADGAAGLGEVEGIPLFPVRTLLVKAEAQIALGKNSDALATLAQAWGKVPPKEKPPARLLGLVLKAHDRWNAPDRAAAAFRDRAFQTIKGQPFDRELLPLMLEELDLHQKEQDLILLLKLARTQKVSDPVTTRLAEKYFKELPEAREAEAEKLYQEMLVPYRNRDFARVAEMSREAGALRPLPELERPLAEVFLNLALLRAEALLELNDLKGAREEIERLAGQPQNPRVKFLTGRLHLAGGTEEKALQSFSEAIQRAPPGAKGQELSAAIRTYMARAHAQRGEGDRVEEMVRLSGNPSDASLITHQAESFCLAASKAADAERRGKLYSQARARLFNIPPEKRTPRDHHLIALCYSNQAEFAKATASFAKAQKAFENDAEFWMDYGRAYQNWAEANKGSGPLHNEAAGRYRKSFEISKSLRAARASATSYLLAGYKKQALAVVQQGLQIDGKDPELRQLLEKVK